ncbi:MAG: PQQ-binding-like beta-propeller repeat protein [Candidatus Latescibacteria bacterium]|nr:PQQ-binding-like beta-propeller repeat protein [Candidatus Latescibacterota bacterium]
MPKLNLSFQNREFSLYHLPYRVSKQELEERARVPNTISYVDPEEVKTYETGLCILVGGSGEPTWQAFFSSSTDNDAACLIWQEIQLVVLGYGNRVYALNMDDGHLSWSLDTDYPIWNLLFSPHRDTLFVQDEVELIQLNERGQEIWSYTHSDVISRVRVEEDHLVLSDLSGNEKRVVYKR